MPQALHKRNRCRRVPLASRPACSSARLAKNGNLSSVEGRRAVCAGCLRRKVRRAVVRHLIELLIAVLAGLLVAIVVAATGTKHLVAVLGYGALATVAMLALIVLSDRFGGRALRWFAHQSPVVWRGWPHSRRTAAAVPEREGTPEAPVALTPKPR